MNLKNKVEVKIAGVVYTLVGVESFEYIHKVAKYIDTKLDIITNSNNKLSTTMASVLTSINIADDYFKALDRIDELNNKSDISLEKINELTNQLNDSKNKNEEQANSIKVIESEKHDYKKLITKLENEIVDYKNSHKKLESEKLEYEKYKAEHEKKNEDYKKLTEELKSEVEKNNNKVIQLRNEVDFLTKKNAEISSLIPTIDNTPNYGKPLDINSKLRLYSKNY